MILSKKNAVQTRRIEYLESELEKQKAITEYVAMMSDIEIPTEEQEVSHEYEVQQSEEIL